MDKYPFKTAAAGNPVGDNQKGLTTGPGAWRRPGAPPPAAR
jgi:hypothetical protein